MFSNKEPKNTNQSDDQKEENQAKRERMVGFTWQLHRDNKFEESLMVSVDMTCPEIKFSVQIFDVVMSMQDKAGVRRSGNRTLFPLSKIKKLEDKSFTWRVSIKAHAFKNE